MTVEVQGYLHFSNLPCGRPVGVVLLYLVLEYSEY